MAVFEITVNGQRRFLGEDVRAITLAADWLARRKVDRVSVHVGIGTPEERQVQYLGADLRPGDEVSIRVLSDEEAEPIDTAPSACSFCGSDMHSIASLVSGPQVAICDSCATAFNAVVTAGAALPVGASIEEQGKEACGFCRKAVPEVAALLVRNGSALCPECLRACADMTAQYQR